MHDNQSRRELIKFSEPNRRHFFLLRLWPLSYCNTRHGMALQLDISLTRNLHFHSAVPFETYRSSPSRLLRFAFSVLQ